MAQLLGRLLSAVLLLSSCFLSALSLNYKEITFKIYNLLEDGVELFWVGHDGITHSQGIIEKDDFFELTSYAGHLFMYTYKGLDHNIMVNDESKDMVLTEANIAKDLKFQLTLRNELPVPVELTWTDLEGIVHTVSQIMPGTDHNLFTFPNHIFNYVYNGKKFEIKTTDASHSYIILQGDADQIQVTCWTSVIALQADRPLSISVQPHWSPRGAARFLDLVRAGYYNGVAIFRVVPNLLAQFGLAADYDMRIEWAEMSFRDDPHPPGVTFQPGMISFAGTGEHSRATQIFVVMPGVAKEDLEVIGRYSWETPFAIVKNVEATAVPHWHSYGDITPWGNGPDPAQIFAKDGYKYLKENFPLLDYIEKCEITQWPTDEEL